MLAGCDKLYFSTLQTAWKSCTAEQDAECHEIIARSHLAKQKSCNSKRSETEDWWYSLSSSIVCMKKSWIVSSYLRASSSGDDTSEEISNHSFKGYGHVIYMDSVNQTQTVLFNQKGETQVSRINKNCVISWLFMVYQ